jgi:glycosyltransferase involved in cell wall biosynthesis
VREPNTFRAVLAEVTRRRLEAHISFLGYRADIRTILANCDIGVLSSRSEGLPISLLEYGAAGLYSISTSVGQCFEVLRGGETGALVAPQSPAELAKAMLYALGNSDRRVNCGRALQKRVTARYSASTIAKQLCDLYDRVLAT